MTSDPDVHLFTRGLLWSDHGFYGKQLLFYSTSCCDIDADDCDGEMGNNDCSYEIKTFMLYNKVDGVEMVSQEMWNNEIFLTVECLNLI